LLQPIKKLDILATLVAVYEGRLVSSGWNLRIVCDGMESIGGKVTIRRIAIGVDANAKFKTTQSK
jgi:hypothetical protein